MTTPDKSLPVHRPATPTPLSLNFDQILQLGDVLAKSRFFGDVRDAAQAVVKILAGRELGLPELASVRGLHIIQGQLTISAHTIAGLIRRSGKYDYEIIEHTNERCKIEFTRPGKPPSYSTYTIEDARKARLLRPDKPGAAWETHPMDMVYARAMSKGAKRFCPDIFLGGIYTAEEFDIQTEDDLAGSPELSPDPDQTPDSLPVPESPTSDNGTAAKAELLATPEQLAGLRKLYEQLPDRSLWPSYLAKYEVKNARDLRATDAAELIEHLAGVRRQTDQLESDIAKGGVPEEAGTKS